MKEKCLIDTSILLKVILEGELDILYHLLPNDALIAATCKHHGIRKIATFDPDFKRVDFLEMLELEEE